MTGLKPTYGRTSFGLETGSQLRSSKEWHYLRTMLEQCQSQDKSRFKHSAHHVYAASAADCKDCTSGHHPISQPDRMLPVVVEWCTPQFLLDSNSRLSKASNIYLHQIDCFYFSRLDANVLSYRNPIWNFHRIFGSWMDESAFRQPVLRAISVEVGSVINFNRTVKITLVVRVSARIRVTTARLAFFDSAGT